MYESEAQRLQREADNFTKKFEHEKKIKELTLIAEALNVKITKSASRREEVSQSFMRKTRNSSKKVSEMYDFLWTGGCEANIYLK